MRLAVFLLSVGLFGYSNQTIAQSDKPDAAQSGAPPWKMAFEFSTDADLLMKTAITLCESRDDNGIDALVARLQDIGFLKRLDLDSPLKSHGQFRVHKVMQAIGSLPEKRAQAAFLTLGKCEAFVKSPYRAGYLVNATGKIQSPSAELLDLLDELGDSDKASRHLIIEAFAQMHSDLACKRIEKWFHSPAAGVTKKSLFVNMLIFERHEPVIVGLYDRLLHSPMSDPILRNLAVQSLFDFRPVDWYGSYPMDSVPKSRMEVSSVVLEEHLRLAEYCLTLDVTDVTKTGVRNAQKAIQRILQFRKNSGPERVDRLIADLDNANFKVRETASQELERLGDLAEVALRKAQLASPSPEMRSRIQQILSKLGAGTGGKRE